MILVLSLKNDWSNSMKFNEVTELQLGQRVRVEYIEDLVAYKNNDKNRPVIIHPAGKVYEGVVFDIYSPEDSFNIIDDDGKRWSFSLPNNKLLVTSAGRKD